MRIHSLLIALHMPLIAASGFYFSTHGAFNNSCMVSQCQTCSTGGYRLGCANASVGVCTDCTRIPNATFTSHGWFNNSCAFVCNAGFVTAGRSCQQDTVLYTVSFPASVTIQNSTNQAFNLTAYIQTVACLAGCAPCVTSADLNPVQCGACSILYKFTASIPVVYRRLLSSASVVDINTTITVDKQIIANMAMNISASALNSKVKCNFGMGGTASMIQAPTLTSQAMADVLPPSISASSPITTPSSPPVEVITTPSTGSSTPPISTPIPASTSDTNTAAIAGGVAGGVVGVALIAGLVWFFTKPVAVAARLGKGKFTFRKAGSGPQIGSQFIHVRRT